ncbi:Endonuclease/exonuclease/phosphatase superfamily [Sesbania bispinosa]|nr:Endonuclease/exonuclease/phosphatase superfamily [Sesbania bispinosa]
MVSKPGVKGVQRRIKLQPTRDDTDSVIQKEPESTENNSTVQQEETPDVESIQKIMEKVGLSQHCSPELAKDSGTSDVPTVQEACVDGEETHTPLVTITDTSAGSTKRLLSLSRNHISMKCSSDSHQSFIMTGLYGHPEEANKVHTIQLIQRLAGECDNTWVLFGDYNLIGSPNEKKGGRMVSLNSCDEVQQCYQQCGLIDMGFEGYPFTWTNGRVGVDAVEQRLDKCFATENFLSNFQQYHVSHLGRLHSDHNPLLITWAQCHDDPKAKKDGIFRFEKAWKDDARFESCIVRSWRRGVATCPEKINDTKDALVLLAKEIGSHTKNMRQLEKNLQEEENWNPSPQNIKERRELLDEYDQMLREDEIYWKQRSRAIWLKEGDRNTAFFHSKASLRQKQNTIKRIRNEASDWVVGSKYL